MWFTRIAAAAALMVVAGCGSSQPASVSTRAQVLEHERVAWLAYAQCARQHGVPDLPDPEIDDNGDARFPPNAIPAAGWPASVLGGCASAWDAVHRWRDQLDQMRPATRINVQVDLRMARCIRQHGFPDFPDPAGDGQTASSPPPGFDKSTGVSPAAAAAIQACQHS